MAIYSHAVPMCGQIAKLCVFCGEKPDRKTKEHVIPKWLIKLTGGDHRQAFLGVKYSDGPDNLAVHRHALSAYTVPACESCNGRFALLEELTKPVVVKLLSEQPISAGDVEILLDWLDKVRIGLWLAGRMIGTNVFRAHEPNFHIAHRIGWCDRWASLTLLPEQVGEGLTYAGVGTPMFGSMPSAFSIRINRLVIQNASSPRILTRWLGLPYPATKRVRTPDGLMFHSHICFGKNRVLPRMMDYGRPFNGLEVFQPAYPFLLKDCERPFKSPYAQRFFVDLERLRAKPLFATDREIRAFEELGKSEFAVMKHLPDSSFPDHFSASTLHLQNYVSLIGLYSGAPVTEHVFYRQRHLSRGLRKLNNLLLRKMAAQWADPTKSNDGFGELELGLKVLSI